MPTPITRSTLLALSLAAAALGGCHSSRSPSGNPPPGGGSGIHFTDVAKPLGLTYRYGHPGKSPLNILQLTTGAGAAFLDYDGDGWLDVLCVSWPRPALFHNEGGKRLVDVTAQVGLRCPEGIWNGCAVGDYNNDGHPDLFLTGYDRTALFRNNGDGTFTDVTEAAGARVRGWCTSAAFADVDRDGFLDLYVGRYLRFTPGMPEFSTVRGVKISLGPEVYEAQRGVLLMNGGGRAFRDATAAAGLAGAQGKALGVAFGDARGRGADDLYVANDRQMCDYFENDGHGHFRAASQRNGTAYDAEARPQSGMGVDFGDFDGDGRLDLFVANFADEAKSLYRNTGDGLFENTAARAGLAQATRPYVAFGAKFLDADGDGNLDLAITNGHVQDLVQQVDPGVSYAQPSQLFRGLGGGRFQDVSRSVGADFARRIVGRALAVGDFDNDGRPDLLLADLEGAPLLLHNDSTSHNHWLGLALTGGAKSNHMAIGARVSVTTGGGMRLREVRTDGSYLAAHDPRVLVGLGGEARAQKIEVRWPSGTKQNVTGLEADRYYHWEEGKQPVAVR